MTTWALRIAQIVAIPVFMAGCDSLPSIDLSPTPVTTAAVPARAVAPPPAPTDPLLVFAASSGPGSSGVVDGQSVRVARAYIAASGRDCRELLVGTGLGERSAIACHDDIAGWTLARPLLRGGGIGRP